MRGFGIDGTISPDVASDVAATVERDGYSSFWVNGSPSEGALNILERAAERTELDLGVGVFSLTRISAEDLVREVVQRDLPEDRLWLGIGSARTPGALAEVQEAVHTLRNELDVRVVMGASRPKMTSLAGEIADAVIFTWWPAAEVEESRVLIEQAAAAAGRHPPTVVSYIRCALLPQAAAVVKERAEYYEGHPRRQDLFAQIGMRAEDIIIKGTSRAELLAGIEAEEAVLDMSVIRAIPAEPTVDSLAELAIACAP